MKSFICAILLLLSAKAFAQSETFTIAVLPDTQLYTEEQGERNVSLFEAQTRWIVENYQKENIVYVVHVGDIVNRGDERPEQWDNAVKALSILEQPLPGLPDGIPYGLAVGNHEQTPSQFAVTGGTKYFNKHFGVKHFKGRSYYGGHYGDDNDSHYDLFSAGGMDFIVIYLEFDAMDEQIDAVNDWAVGLCQKYADRKAIIVSHYLINNNPAKGTNLGGKASWGKQGERIYDRLKTCPNVFMMLCGHIGDNGEGYRQDTHAGHTIKTFLADYQSRPLGGGSLMRLITFDKENDLIRVRTIAPATGIEEMDGDSHFVRPWTREATASRLYDFDNDGKSELATYRKGIWTIDGQEEIAYGPENGIPVPGNYLGDGKCIPAVYDDVQGLFYILGRGIIPWGKAGDIPMPADYDGDGVTDIAVWRPSDRTLHVMGKAPIRVGELPAVTIADYDGDGQVEFASYRLKNHTFYIQSIANIPLGQEGDIPVPADYNGDGRAEITVYRPSTGEWIIYGEKPVVCGGDENDIPVPGDYDGSGRVQFAVYNLKTGILTTQTGKQIQWEGSIDELANIPPYTRLYLKHLAKDSQ